MGVYRKNISPKMKLFAIACSTVAFADPDKFGKGSKFTIKYQTSHKWCEAEEVITGVETNRGSKNLKPGTINWECENEETYWPKMCEDKETEEWSYCEDQSDPKGVAVLRYRGGECVPKVSCPEGYFTTDNDRFSRFRNLRTKCMNWAGPKFPVSQWNDLNNDGTMIKAKHMQKWANKCCKKIRVKGKGK